MRVNGRFLGRWLVGSFLDGGYADGGGGEEARGSRFLRGKARISSLSTSYNVVDQLKLTPVSASVWNYIKDSDKVRKELMEALKKGDEEIVEGAAAMPGVAKVVAAAPVEKEAPRASYIIFQIPQNINEEDEERIKERMEEQDFLKWMEEMRVAMAEEEGRMELNVEEEDE
ncbi:unnamed protein product [Closterium sp. Naga37s-1]|nr:unnamed protein product [Closterium sp. Naga37s-1]